MVIYKLKITTTVLHYLFPFFFNFNFYFQNRGIYMFRLDEERVIDATISGGLARYINHSCNPNCVAEIVEVDRDLRIIIFAKRRILRGEEVSLQTYTLSRTWKLISTMML